MCEMYADTWPKHNKKTNKNCLQMLEKSIKVHKSKPIYEYRNCWYLSYSEFTNIK